jgi:hypothetical protein
MTDTTHSNSAWDAIEQSRRFDRFVRRACIAAWTGALVAVLGYGALVVAQIVHLLRLAAVGGIMTIAALEEAKPLLIIIGVISLLIATLTTLGIFMRQRAVSLSEIQLRLAALEDMLQGQGGGGSAP